mgnify:FL=1
MQPSDADPSLSVLSLDIETDIDNGTVLTIGLYYRFGPAGSPREERSEVLHRGPVFETDGMELSFFEDERGLLQGMMERIRELDPDIITGWNVIDFDFRVLKRRVDQYGVRVAVRRSREAAHFLSGDEGGDE